MLKHRAPADSEQDTAAHEVSRHSGGFKVLKKILQAFATCGDCPRKYRNWRCDSAECIYFTFDSVQFQKFGHMIFIYLFIFTKKAFENLKIRLHILTQLLK